MIDHVTIYVKDLERSKAFYELAFAPLGFQVAFGKEGVFWAFDIGKGFLFEIAQYNGKSPITTVHIAFRVNDIEKIQAFYKAAIDAGAMDNGAPGPRPQYTENYYACFVHDLDGHNIEATFDKWPE